MNNSNCFIAAKIFENNSSEIKNFIIVNKSLSQQKGIITHEPHPDIAIEKCLFHELSPLTNFYNRSWEFL